MLSLYVHYLHCIHRILLLSRQHELIRMGRCSDEDSDGYIPSSSDDDEEDNGSDEEDDSDEEEEGSDEEEEEEGSSSSSSSTSDSSDGDDDESDDDENACFPSSNFCHFQRWHEGDNADPYKHIDTVSSDADSIVLINHEPGEIIKCTMEKREGDNLDGGGTGCDSPGSFEFSNILSAETVQATSRFSLRFPSANTFRRPSRRATGATGVTSASLADVPNLRAGELLHGGARFFLQMYWIGTYRVSATPRFTDLELTVICEAMNMATAAHFTACKLHDVKSPVECRSALHCYDIEVNDRKRPRDGETARQVPIHNKFSKLSASILLQSFKVALYYLGGERVQLSKSEHHNALLRYFADCDADANSGSNSGNRWGVGFIPEHQEFAASLAVSTLYTLSAIGKKKTFTKLIGAPTVEPTASSDERFKALENAIKKGIEKTIPKLIQSLFPGLSSGNRTALYVDIAYTLHPKREDKTFLLDTHGTRQDLCASLDLDEENSEGYVLRSINARDPQDDDISIRSGGSDEDADLVDAAQDGDGGEPAEEGDAEEEEAEGMQLEATTTEMFDEREALLWETNTADHRKAAKKYSSLFSTHMGSIHSGKIVVHMEHDSVDQCWSLREIIAAADSDADIVQDTLDGMVGGQSYMDGQRNVTLSQSTTLWHDIRPLATLVGEVLRNPVAELSTRTRLNTMVCQLDKGIESVKKRLKNYPGFAIRTELFVKLDNTIRMLNDGDNESQLPDLRLHSKLPNFIVCEKSGFTDWYCGTIDEVWKPVRSVFMQEQFRNNQNAIMDCTQFSDCEKTTLVACAELILQEFGSFNYPYQGRVLSSLKPIPTAGEICLLRFPRSDLEKLNNCYLRTLGLKFGVKAHAVILPLPSAIVGFGQAWLTDNIPKGNLGCMLRDRTYCLHICKGTKAPAVYERCLIRLQTLIAGARQAGLICDYVLSHGAATEDQLKQTSLEKIFESTQVIDFFADWDVKLELLGRITEEMKTSLLEWIAQDIVFLYYQEYEDRFLKRHKVLSLFRTLRANRRQSGLQQPLDRKTIFPGMPKATGELQALLSNSHMKPFFEEAKRPGITSLSTLYSRLICARTLF